MDVLMKCGCVAQGYRITEGGNIPVCLVHDCIEQAKKMPDLTGRTAKCSYFGKVKPNRRYANDECNYGCKGERICKCGSEPSNYNLAFFEYHPDKEQDTFYCGCFGWD